MTPKVQRRCTKESWWPPLYTAGIAAVRRARASSTGLVCFTYRIYIYTSPTIYLFLSFWFLISLEGATHASVAKPNNSKWFHQRFHWRKFIRLAVTQSPRRGVNSDGQLIFRLVSYTAGFYSTLMICNKFISLSRIETLGTNISINPSE